MKELENFTTTTTPILFSILKFCLLTKEFKLWPRFYASGGSWNLKCSIVSRKSNPFKEIKGITDNPAIKIDFLCWKTVGITALPHILKGSEWLFEVQTQIIPGKNSTLIVKNCGVLLVFTVSNRFHSTFKLNFWQNFFIWSSCDGPSYSSIQRQCVKVLTSKSSLYVKCKFYRQQASKSTSILGLHKKAANLKTKFYSWKIDFQYLDPTM